MVTTQFRPWDVVFQRSEDTTKGLRVPKSRGYHWTRYLTSLGCSNHTASLLVEHSDVLNQELLAFRSAKHKDRSQSHLSDR